MGRNSRLHALASAVPPVLLYGGAALWLFTWGREELHGIQDEVLILVSVFALWRYGWQLLHYARAAWYAAWHYPRLRATARRVAQARPWPKRIFVVVPSYLEEAWVSQESMPALMTNLLALPCAATVVVAVGSEEDEQVIAAASEPYLREGRIELVFQRQSQGKRIAMGHALRAVARRYDDEPDGVTVFMDGDSWLEPGSLLRVLPFFMAYRDLGAVTTNEQACIPGGSPWYRNWFDLKFGQRQVLFQSHSLSHKVLTLTGRFSVLRTSIVVQEDFLRMMENDTIEHWLHGRFRFLMGDDKSSWFHVLRGGWSMLYLPDVTCVSLESRNEPFLKASVSLPYRWFGNTLRNNPRSLALGPGRTGWFIWFVLLDQRISMWSSLVGIAGAGVLAITKSVLFLPLYLSWAVLVRSVQLVVIAWHGHAVSLRTIPIMLYTQWVGSIVKIKAWHHLADQDWSKGKAKQKSVQARGLRRLVPTWRMAFAYAAFALAVLLTHSALRLPGTELFAAQSAPAEVIDAGRGKGGVRPDDGQDDAAALQALIDRQPPGPITLRLPAGQLDFMQPLVIRRDEVTLVGAGRERTRIVSHVGAPQSAVIRVEGQPGPRVGYLARPLAAGDTLLKIATPAPFEAGSLVWLKQANDDALFRQLGSQQWRREYPFLRQALVKVAGRDEGGLRLSAPTGLDFDAGRTEVLRVRPVRGVRLADFTIEQRAPGRDIASLRHVYENAVPAVAVDAISLFWTDDAQVERVTVLNAGRHPVSIEQSHGFTVRDCLLDGAWNKGDGGSGYLRIARSYRGTVEHCTVRNIRHIALQWSSAFNALRDIDTEVDVNFHGGNSHHNTVRDVRFAIPPEHKWGPVFQTPKDARWAPPDGPGNTVVSAATTASTAPAGRAASPAR
ncbi:glycosyltransferase [Ramlibacter alkalitolerans]|uniref:Glycosyltransferase n=1 Tax=Ramlibacter alkalitolerans TaxID=2039631 RepID=A0ABS1JV98_9BURK|nr:glycosyltransferase [Ramlibacter alkalitolerans]MBL0428143.1 glycosyltransferase [Ramlibacter alkalitolerans]